MSTAPAPPPVVVLITGPMGSGKTTLAQHLARRLDGACLSEDSYWASHGWAGLRTPDQERAVQAEVVDDLLGLWRAGRTVLLEFITYAEPPNAVTAYRLACADHAIPCQVIIVTASVPEILRRIAARGRPDDRADLEQRRRQVEHQVRILDSPAMRSYDVVDGTGQSIDDVARTCLQLIDRLPR